MEKAKAAVSDFIGKSGKHDTTVHESVAPHVQHETVKPHRHENVTTAVDKEVHQDHYHRTVQPVHDREVLPEQHHANLGKVEHREFDHRDHEGTKRTLATDQAAFKDQSVTRDTTHSQSAMPTVGGEHVHHHIHETIQPVVHKETVQPHVVHTTVPIHETHHNTAKHHETSHLPALSMAEFKNKGGVLGGREEKYDGFEGEPKHIGGKLTHMMEGHGKHDSAHADHVTKKGAMHGDHDPLDGRGLDPTRDANPSHRGTGGLGTTGTHHHGANDVRGIDGVGATGTHGTGNVRGVEESNPQYHGSTKEPLRSSNTTGSDLNTTTSGKKPSLMDKLNPKIDSNGDGKAGFMK